MQAVSTSAKLSQHDLLPLTKQAFTPCYEQQQEKERMNES